MTVTKQVTRLRRGDVIKVPDGIMIADHISRGPSLTVVTHDLGGDVYQQVFINWELVDTLSD